MSPHRVTLLLCQLLLVLVAIVHGQYSLSTFHFAGDGTLTLQLLRNGAAVKNPSGNFVVELSGTGNDSYRAVEPKPETMKLVNGMVVRQFNADYVVAQFTGISNGKTYAAQLREVKNAWIAAKDGNVVGKTACDWGVVDYCMTKYQYSSESGSGKCGSHLDSSNLGREYCLHKQLDCLKRYSTYTSDMLNVSAVVASTIAVQCGAFMIRRRECHDWWANNELRSKANSDKTWLYAVDNWVGNCWFHVKGTTSEGQGWWRTAVGIFNDRVRRISSEYDYATVFSLSQVSRPTPESVCTKLSTAPVQGVSPCGSSPQLKCGVCPNNATSCGQQTCEFASSVTPYNFGGAPAVHASVNIGVVCKCQRPNTSLVVTKVDSGSVQFQWPALFSCEHVVALKDERSSGEQLSYGSEYDCGLPNQHVSSYSLNGIPPGTRKGYAITGAVLAERGLSRESLTVNATLYVPFETHLSAQVMTASMTGVSNRLVTFSLLFSAEQRQSSSPWSSSSALSLKVYVNGASTAQSLPFSDVVTFTAPTTSSGVAAVRLVMPTTNASGDLTKFESVLVRATPAAASNMVIHNYNDCAAPCSREAIVPHGHAAPTPAQVGATFIDTTTITVRAKVPFLNRIDCFATDLLVEAVDTTSGMVIGNSTTDDTGLFAVVVPIARAVTLRFTRTALPEYYYVANTSAVVAPTIAVTGRMTDFQVPVPFALATTSAPYRLLSVRVPIVGGICEFPLADTLQVSKFKWGSPSCNDGAPFDVAVGVAPDNRAITINNVPPLLFGNISFVLGTAGDQSAAHTQFSTDPAQPLDARLPALERQTGKASNVSGEHLETVLFDGLLLALPLAKDTLDRSQYRHVAAPTRDTGVRYAGEAALELEANGSALTFGRNDRLDVGGALTLALWLDVRTFMAGVTVAPLLSVVNASLATDAFEVALVPTDGNTFSVRVRSGATVLATAAGLSIAGTRRHVAVVVADGSTRIFVNGVIVANGAASAFGVRSSICSQEFQYDCVREVTLFASAGEGAAGFGGRVSDFAMWSRALTPSDIAFLTAAGRDGVPFEALLPANDAFPRFVYRSNVEMDLPANGHRYLTPPGDADEQSDPTLEQLLNGVAAVGHTCKTAEGAGTQDHTIYKVKTNGAVVVLAELWETYNARRCYRVQGTVKMRSTFTSACLPAMADRNNSNILPCEVKLNAGAFGYVYFHGIVGPAILLPRDPMRTDGGASRASTGSTFDALKPFLGEFQFRFAAVRNSVEQALYYHVTGFSAPDAPSVYSLPTRDVPILRLYRPPGSGSSASLERNWAKSARIGFSMSKGKQQTVSSAVSLRRTIGVDTTICNSGGLGVGAGAVAITLTTKCTDTKASAFVATKLQTDEKWAQTDSYSLSEAFSTEVLTAFETSVNDLTIGKWGDIVVTVGVTILVSDSYFNTMLPMSDGRCEIDQQYSPNWKPSPEGIVDSLQVTPRIGVQPIIDDWQRQVDVISRDCGGRLSGPLLDFYNVTLLTATNFTQCTQLDKMGVQVAVKGADLKELVQKFQQASAGVRRWSAILQNWEAVFCAALSAAGVADYYANDGAPACSQVNSSGIEVQKPAIWNVLDANGLPGTRTMSAGVIESLQGKTKAVGEFCDKSVDSRAKEFSLGNRVDSIIDCSKATSKSYTPLQQTNGVYKLALTAPYTFAYATTASVTRTETYSLSSASEWSLVSETAGGNELKLFGSNTNGELSIGGGGGGGGSSSMEGEIQTSDTTAVSFTLEDGDVDDQIGISVFADPTYGTPIFVTTGGWTSCPAEPGTNVRQKIRAFPVTRDATEAIEKTNSDPDGAIELELSALLESQRAKDSSFSFYLQVHSDDSDFDLTVTYKGELVSMDDDHTVTVTNTDYTKFGPIIAKRGKRFSYSGVFVALVSTCDGSVAGGVYYHLKWAPKCAVVEIDPRVNTSVAGSLFPSERPFFIVNSQTPAAATVRVRNPLPIEAPWTLVENTFTVRVQYRAVSEQSQWTNAPGDQRTALVFCQNGAPAGAAPSCYAQCTQPGAPRCCQGHGAVCSASQACCRDVGLVCGSGVCQYASSEVNATVTIDASGLQVQEGQYELRAVTTCSNGLETTSEPVRGRIDRVAPRLFGTFQEPADRVWWPGDEISLRFTEDIQCDRPFRFQTTLLVDGVPQTVGNPLDVVCSASKIELAFARTLISAPDAIIGKQISLRIAGVPDLALNPIAGAAEWSFTVGAFDEQQASVSLSDVRVPVALATSADPSAAIRQALFGDSAGAAQVSATVSGGDKKRALSPDVETSLVRIDIKAANMVEGGMSAVRVASAILKSDMVDASASNIAIAAPGNPGGATTTNDTQTRALIGEEMSSEEFFSTPGGYAVIAVLAAVGLALIIGLAVCLVRRNGGSDKHKRSAKETELPAVVAESASRESQLPPLTESRSRRSRRSEQPYGQQPYGQQPYGQQPYGQQPGTMQQGASAPPPTVGRSGSRRSASGRRISRRRSSRRAQAQPQQPQQPQQQQQRWN